MSDKKIYRLILKDTENRAVSVDIIDLKTFTTSSKKLLKDYNDLLKVEEEKRVASVKNDDEKKLRGEKIAKLKQERLKLEKSKKPPEVIKGKVAEIDKQLEKLNA